jgi:hypothetical protein
MAEAILHTKDKITMRTPRCKAASVDAPERGG